MLHHVARSVPGTILFRTWPEGLALWDRVIEACPGLVALCVMPDHLHLLHADDLRPRLASALSGYARWRNHARGQGGPVWQRQPAPTEVGDEQKRRRTERYVHLNPCRAGLVDDPLAWPLSTYRDAVGLSARPVRERVPDPARHHGYVCRDDTVTPRSELPCNPVLRWDGEDAVGPVLAAVTEVLRVSHDALERRGSARTLAASVLLRRARLPASRVGELLGFDPSAVRRLSKGDLRLERLVVAVAGDPRFRGLHDRDLRATPGWARFRARD